MYTISIHGKPMFHSYMPWNSNAVSIGAVFGDDVTFYFHGDDVAALRFVLALDWTEGGFVSTDRDEDSLRGDEARRWCEARLASLTETVGSEAA